MASEIISNDQYDLISNQQRHSKKIVAKEINRLQQKKNNMDVERHNADRMILLNNSYKEKQKHYLILLVIILLTFGISLAIVFLQERLGYSTTVMDWLIIFVVAIGIISAFNLLNNILMRDNIDFNKLSQYDNSILLPTSSIGDSNNNYDEKAKAGQISEASAEACRGPDCCGPGYTWDSGANQCKP